jgi:lipopolysaccharide transport system permease protein
LNPVNGAIELFRAGLTNGVIDIKIILIGVISSFIILLTGIYFFRKTEAYFADIA